MVGAPHSTAGGTEIATKKEVVAPTPERLARGDVETVLTIQAGVAGYRVQCPHALERYHSRGELGKGMDNGRRYDAGCRIRDAFESAGLQPTVIGAYRDLVAGGSHSPVDHQVGAYEAWRRAVVAIGPIACDEVIEVACLGNPLRDRARMEILRRGLEVLAVHYGM